MYHFLTLSQICFKGTFKAIFNNFKSNISSLKTVSFDNQTYKVGEMLLLEDLLYNVDEESYDLPNIGTIRFLLKNKLNEVCCVYEKITVLKQNYHLCAYEIEYREFK